MRYWRFVLGGALAVAVGLGVGVISGSWLPGLGAAASVALICFYMVWEKGSHGPDAGNLSGKEKDSEEARYTGGYAGFHDGGGGGMG